ncbi:MAG TPA: permease-like cell division protein FtsX [Streptosporangiaceae bacterium]|jgi:cell division transport system permease protein|nr:permease-like cell division protein FtsX [Streptosporangiaceae bacterium]
MRSQFVLSEVWIGLRRNLTMTMALIVVVAISLSLLGTGLLFVKQVDKTSSLWQSKVEMSIYFCIPTSDNQPCQANGAATQTDKSQLESQLAGMAQVQHVYYVSQQQAYQEFVQYYAGQPLVTYTTQSDIPDSLQVKLKDATADFPVVNSAVSGAPGVANVVNDVQVLGSFYKLLDTARNSVVIIALMLLVAAGMLVANTIRLAAFNRRRETAIMRLVGASNFYIQLPFLLEGAIAGLVGWLISDVLVVAAKSFVLDALEQNQSLSVGLSLGDLLEVMAFTLLAALLLSGATSFLTLRRYLRT